MSFNRSLTLQFCNEQTLSNRWLSLSVGVKKASSELIFSSEMASIVSYIGMLRNTLKEEENIDFELNAKIVGGGRFATTFNY